MSKWKRTYVELDENGALPYGKFTVCSTCASKLPSWTEETNDEEHILWHGYCSKNCASEGGYANYQW